MQRILLTTILGLAIAAAPVFVIDHNALGKSDHAGSSSKGGGEGKSGKGDKGGGKNGGAAAPGGGAANGPPSSGNGKAEGGASASKSSDGGSGKSGSAGAGQKGSSGKGSEGGPGKSAGAGQKSSSGKGSSNKGAASSPSPARSGASSQTSGPAAGAAVAGPKLGMSAIATLGTYSPVHRAGSQRLSLPGRLRPERAANLPQARQALQLALQGTFDLLAPSDGSPVSACRQAITLAAQPLGALRVSVGGLGPVRRGAGGYTAPIGVSIRYPREVRQARIQCRLNSAGVVIGFR
jgi:hypothetical protein